MANVADTQNILVLGGTSEASELVKLLARQRIKTILSLAGRTRNPVLPGIDIPDANFSYRIGGFGGITGLAGYIRGNHITALVCATHPFARTMPFNALEAAKISGIPLLYILRPEWKARAGDNWIEVASHKEAIQQLITNAPQLKNIFLTVGRLEIAEYATAPQYFYIIRTIDDVKDKLLPNALYITDRPPFTVENERNLIREHKIDVIISKNSGGCATEAKLAAARESGIPVILINRPPRPAALHVATAAEAIACIENMRQNYGFNR